MKLRIKGMKSFWDDYKRTKRGVVGLIFICIFAFLAVSGPNITPFDPLNPLIEDYPAGSVPIASELAAPTFQKYLLMVDLSENMKVIPDHKLSLNETFKRWVAYSNTQLVNVAYTQNEGYESDGAIKVTYATHTEPPPKPVATRLIYNFTYPYKTPPGNGGFYVHLSFKVAGDVTPDSTVNIKPYLRRIQGPNPLENYTWPLKTYESGQLVYVYPLYTRTPLTFTAPKGWSHVWIRSIGLESFMPAYTPFPWKTVFPTAGNYTFDVEIEIKDKVKGEKSISILLDNLDVLIYGQAFGNLGTDGQRGRPRDIFTSILYGARLSVFLGLTCAFLSVTIGLIIGLVSGYFGGVIDEVLMRITDILMCLPGLPLILVLIAVLGRSIITLLIILSCLGWMGFARNVRSLTLSIRERAFVEAARASGARGLYIVFSHVFPNVITLAYLALAFSVPSIVLTEAALSWLGFYDPKIVTWGRMLSEFTESGVASTSGFSEYWWWIICPGVMISLLTISFILVGYSLDEILNPRLRMRR